jgi:predicted RNA-binding Zn-ribbon protein involved in translation (DUF1610 family)
MFSKSTPVRASDASIYRDEALFLILRDIYGIESDDLASWCTKEGTYHTDPGDVAGNPMKEVPVPKKLWNNLGLKADHMNHEIYDQIYPRGKRKTRGKHVHADPIHFSKVTGLKGKVGIDYPHYAKDFDLVQDHKWKEDVRPRVIALLAKAERSIKDDNTGRESIPFICPVCGEEDVARSLTDIRILYTSGMCPDCVFAAVVEPFFKKCPPFAPKFKRKPRFV